MFCRECGKMLQDGTKFCTGCGTKIEPIKICNNSYSNNSYFNKSEENNINKLEEKNNIDNNSSVNNNSDNNNKNNNNDNYNNQKNVVIIKKDKQNVWLNILSFFIPIVGVILFLCNFQKTPNKAKYIGIYAVIGYIIGKVISIVISFNTFSPIFNDRFFDDDFFNNHHNFQIERNIWM